MVFVALIKLIDEYTRKTKAALISISDYAIFIVLLIEIIKVNT